MDLLEVFEGIDEKIVECAIYAKAVRYCRCGETLLSEFDEDAERHTYALVTRRLQQGEEAFAGVERTLLMDDVKRVLEYADSACGVCGDE